MASLSTDKHGNTTIQFVAADRRRRSIRLGKRRVRDCEKIKRMIGVLNVPAGASVGWDRELAEWIAGLDDELRGKLARAGLLPGWSTTLAEFVDRYIASRMGWKPDTRRNYLDVRAKLVARFGADMPIGKITALDADQFRLALSATLADNTVRKICSRAKTLFRAAQRARIIWESPFADMKGTSVRENRARDFFVDREMTAKLLAGAPDPQWAAIIALCRFGGLRCPSEIRGLTWGDVDWTLGRITIHQTKVEHHEGKETRVAPLFVELRGPLEAVLNELLADFDPKANRLSEQPIIRSYRCHKNLGTQLKRIIKRAGLTPWPKLFQNLRASRATELAAEHPAHVAADWMGHSTKVADKHYWRTTDSDYERALQNPVQQAVVTPVTPVSPVRDERKISAEIVDLGECALVLAPPVGLEPTT